MFDALYGLLAIAVLLRGEEVLANPKRHGMIVKTTTLRHLYAYHYYGTPKITYWRDAASVRETHIIMKSSAYYYAFEIKYRERVDLDAKSGLALYDAAEGLKRTYLATKQGADFGVIGSQDASTCVESSGAYSVLFAGADGEIVVGVNCDCIIADLKCNLVSKL